MTGACDPECAKWAESFGDCICSSSDLISFIAGLASVVFMGICFLPQIVINLKNGSSEGLSFIMVLVWSVGDACNIAGVFLTKAVSPHPDLNVPHELLPLAIQVKLPFSPFQSHRATLPQHKVLITLVYCCSCQLKFTWHACLPCWT